MKQYLNYSFTEYKSVSTQANAPKEPKVDKGEALYQRKLVQHLTYNSTYFILTAFDLTVLVVVSVSS